MEITTDTIETKSEIYDDFELLQLIVLMDIGEKLTISIDDVMVKEYTAKFSNCHFNMQWQDKGEKINLEQLTEVQVLQRQIDKLEAEKTIEEAKVK